MEKEKTIGIKVLGWFLIILSFIYLIGFPNAISLHHKLYSIVVGFPTDINFMLIPLPIVITSVKSLLFLISGIGILKLKRWSYYLTLYIPFLYSMLIIGGMWSLGPQSIMRPSLFSALFISIIILSFLMRKNIIEEFSADYITRRGKKLNPEKFILATSIGVVLMTIMLFSLSLFFINVVFKDKLRIINLKPQKIEYQIQDKSFILNNCEKRYIFGYSVYIPKDWKIGNISMGGSGFGWNLSFFNMENAHLKNFILLDSEGFGGVYLHMSKILNFNTAYDFEKAINYPNWALLYTVLKTVSSKNLESIDEATTFTWRGFVKIVKSKESDFYVGSLYSLKRNKACSITILSKEGVMASEQAKSIIASLEFSAIDRQSEPLFENGKADLSKADFTSAAINFMNALYINERNPEYAYYLARSLFEDSSSSGRTSRLGSSKRFLEYVLKLNPSYQEAKELLAAIDKEIEQTNLSAKKE